MRSKAYQHRQGENSPSEHSLGPMHIQVDDTVRKTVIEKAGHKPSPLPAYLNYG